MNENIDNSHRRLSKPVYEVLPYLYAGVGVLGILAAYWLAGRFWSDVCLVLGIAGLLGGLVLILRRRDYRSNLGRYSRRSLEESIEPKSEDKST